MTEKQIDIINNFLGEAVTLEDGRKTIVVGFDGNPHEDEGDVILLVALGNKWTFGESRDAVIPKSYRDNKFEYAWSDEIGLVEYD